MARTPCGCDEVGGGGGGCACPACSPASASIAADLMGHCRGIDSVDRLGEREVASVLDVDRRGVEVIVAADTVVAEDVRVLDAEVEPGVVADEGGQADERRVGVVEMEPVVDVLIGQERGCGKVRHDVQPGLVVVLACHGAEGETAGACASDQANRNGRARCGISQTVAKWSRWSQ